MADFRARSTVLITCPKRTSPFLREEIEALGFPILAEFPTGVEIEGTLEDTMLLNLHVRTGYHVHFLLKSFIAATPDGLYKNISEIPWEDYIEPDGYLSVVSTVDNPNITDSRFANVKCKDAIVDRMRHVTGRRPDSGSERSGVVVYLFWRGTSCRVFLDTSGEPLTKRGYRKIPYKAPMQESLAAAVILATGWRGDGNLVNPMCGSGTLAIEAAMIGLNRAPGLLRENFAFVHLRGFDPEHWAALRKRAKSAATRKIDGRIVVSDIDEGAVMAARKNAANAGVDHLMDFHVCDFAATPVPEGGGIVMLNPEYGARLGTEVELEETYHRIGDFFKKDCRGYTGYIFTGNPHLAKQVGLRTKRKIPFFNTTLDCRLLEYELYEGSRKHSAADEQEQQS
ncbi:MAG: class I SAM-dependent RNA methyltransferase [Candidatus Kapaibacterium sp.]